MKRVENISGQNLYISIQQWEKCHSKASVQWETLLNGAPRSLIISLAVWDNIGGRCRVTPVSGWLAIMSSAGYSYADRTPGHRLTGLSLPTRTTLTRTRQPTTTRQREDSIPGADCGTPEWLKSMFRPHWIRNWILNTVASVISQEFCGGWELQ